MVSRESNISNRPACPSRALNAQLNVHLFDILSMTTINYSGYKCVHLGRIYVCIAAMSSSICPESCLRLQIRIWLLSLILLSLLWKSCMRNAHQEFLSDSEMRDIEDIMAARYQLNTEVCRNFSRVRLLGQPNGRFLKRLRCVSR